MKNRLLFLCLTFSVIAAAQPTFQFQINAQGKAQITDSECIEAKNINLLLLKEAINERHQIADSDHDFVKTLKYIKSDHEMRSISYCLIRRLNNQYEFLENKFRFTFVLPTNIDHAQPIHELTLSNVSVSSTETALDFQIENQAPIHLSCATEKLHVNGYFGIGTYLEFWNTFFSEVHPETYLTAYYQKQFPELTDFSAHLITVSKLIADSNEREHFSTKKLNFLQQELAVPSSNDQAIAALISIDKKTVVRLCARFGLEFYDNGENTFFTYEIEVYQKSADAWNKTNNQYLRSDSTEMLLSFYARAYTNSINPVYDEASWIHYFLSEETDVEDEGVVYKKLRSANLMHEKLVYQYIQPKLQEQLANEAAIYNAFYQRKSSIWEDVVTSQDLLLANPDNSVYIYPVLLNRSTDTANQEEYYGTLTNEDFKFYVLLKDENGKYQLYDWHYFKPLPYKDYYQLLKCAHTHLSKVSNWDGESLVINDPKFWNDFVTKKNERGYAYLSPVLGPQEANKITKSEFDAQVADCIFLLKDRDISDLYDNQVKQLILCSNTLTQQHLTGAAYSELQQLMQTLNVQKRILRRYANTERYNSKTGFYIPQLNLELGRVSAPSSYYQLIP
ncbi:MAG: hypothetical protein RLZZ301_1480 [Bacteroidota bacterium]|jgi:hypothetical protein